MSEDIIKKYRIFAKKSLGQNFLVDENILKNISDIVSVEWNNIIEVGPWYGALTEYLLHATPKSLHLVELDRDMIEILEDRVHIWELQNWKVDFKIHTIDVLDFTPEFQDYSVIANIPYYITSPILRHFLYGLKNTPKSMVILMQKDVGDKILGKWKNKSSVLSLFVEKKCRVTERIFVPKESFIPQPKIESSVLLFEVHGDYNAIDDNTFLEIIKKWFLAPRKKLIKNLVSWGFEKNKIEVLFHMKGWDENLRWEDLSINEWCILVENLS